MSYQVLARKWRPGTFGDMVGQAHVLKPLIHALDHQRLHHAYLFTGTRGVGKTTLARILARCLNCEQGVSSRPCGACSACLEIAEGRFIDLIEVDAASRTKVEDTRELLENVQYAPSRGRFKIYLIDEVHMLSGHSFNALLKTLEEPPPHVKFLLATTDPQKLPVTILSRCLQFNLKSLTPQLIEAHLADILGREKIGFEEQALWQLAAAAAGSMRDALTLLDQAISFCEGRVDAQGVGDMLGTPDQGIVFELLGCLCDRDGTGLLGIVERVADFAADYEQLLASLLASLHRIAIAQVSAAALDNSAGDRDRVLAFAGRISPEDLQLYYQFCTKARAEFTQSVDQRASFEMLLLRMLVFSPDGRPRIPPLPESSPAQRDDGDAAPQPGSGQVAGAGREKKKPLGTETKPIAPTGAAPPDPLAELDEAGWIGFCGRLKVAGIAGSILSNCTLVGVAGDELSLVLDVRHSALYSEDHRLRLEQALAEALARPLRLRIEIGEPRHESPAEHANRIRSEQLAEVRQRFENDGNVRDLLSRFGGEIIPESITPIDK